MPNRIIHEKAVRSATLDALSDFAERLFFRLTTQADDFGRFDADPRVLLAACFPRRVGRLKVSHVLAARDELVAGGLVRLYEGQGRLYGVIVTWGDYQRSRAHKSKYPAPEDPAVHPISPQSAATRRNPPQSAAIRGDSPQSAATRGDPPPISIFDIRESIVENRCNPSPRAEEAADPPQSAATCGDPAWPSAEALVELYNAAAPDNVPAVEELSAKRREKARRALRAYPERAWWVEVFAQYRQSKFLSGKTPPREGHGSFRPDFDWLLSNGRGDGVENHVKVHDGAYQD